jgi:predicted nucleic acid-binding protein
MKLKSRLKRWKLSQPELEAIYLSRKSKRMFLTDDLDAREAAESIDIEVHGSVGIIVKAFKERVLTLEETIRGLNDLYEKSRLFVSKIIIDEVIRAVRKHKQSH